MTSRFDSVASTWHKARVQRHRESATGVGLRRFVRDGLFWSCVVFGLAAIGLMTLSVSEFDRTSFTTVLESSDSVMESTNGVEAIWALALSGGLVMLAGVMVALLVQMGRGGARERNARRESSGSGSTLS